MWPESLKEDRRRMETTAGLKLPGVDAVVDDVVVLLGGVGRPRPGDGRRTDTILHVLHSVF